MIALLISVTYLACGFLAARRVYIQESENFKPYFSKWKGERVEKPEDMVIWPYVFTGPFLLMLWGLPYLGRPFLNFWHHTVKAETPAMRKEREEAEYKKNLAVLEDKPKPEPKKDVLPIDVGERVIITTCDSCKNPMIHHWSGLCGVCQAKYRVRSMKPNGYGHKEVERFFDE